LTVKLTEESNTLNYKHKKIAGEVEKRRREELLEKAKPVCQRSSEFYATYDNNQNNNEGFGSQIGGNI
jgi:hypothetical protein